MPGVSGHELRKRRTRAAILEAATTLFDEQGFAATTVAEIAAVAGVSQRTFFVHFPAKEDLLFAHLDDTFEVAFRAVDDADSRSPADRTAVALEAMIEAVTGDPTLTRQAVDRVSTAAHGRLPRSFAAHLLSLSEQLIRRVAEATGAPVGVVAPIVGAAVGAIEAAGYVAAAGGASADDLRSRMTKALDQALTGFRGVRPGSDETAPVAGEE